MSMDAHRSTDQDEDRLKDYSRNRSTSSAESTAECSAVRIMTHKEFAEKHPHPPSPFYVKLDRPHEPAFDRHRETDIDRPPSPPIDRRAPLTYRVRLLSIDSNRINALRPPPKPLANPPKPTPNPSDTTPEPMQVDEATEGRVLRKRKEKIPKHLKREANEKEMDETKETEEDIRRMFHYIRERMKLRITLKKKSDPGKFAIPYTLEDRLEKCCDDIYFPFDVKINGLDSQAEWLQKEVKAIQRQLASQHQISTSIDGAHSKSIDRKEPATIDRHFVASIDTTSTPDDTQLIPNHMESMQEQLNEVSEYAYSKISWYQFSIEDILERLQNISNAVQKMDERWTRNDEATRSFIAAWSRMCRDDVDACFPTSSCFSTN
ncbi:hypothetical protein DY000_02059598 [Brassica cretica]|uniref:DUF632 domain-containing protein n=1 Tax=Brassica cretica TaxID=69181 RepID=A0ABQ7AS70_BRACR|nr:hypothetical protein DY000_02059598 [Brassica cretica]